ncbi:SHOCT domain-containing protein [Vandammella animalimorsus]|uniref:SHOCT domain-containing protein n=1 Tax=Vandammella animalimorsus TaxID=2029117 RepID=UPI001178A7ED|nr:SHOCT domain-containing protein [Vandammella animalimorsus]
MGLFLLFCFLWGVASLFGNAKDAARRWSKRRHIQRSAQDIEEAPKPLQLTEKTDVTVIENPRETKRAPRAQSAPQAAPQAAPQTTPKESPMSAALAQLREADALREKGVIAPAEFEKIKQQILSSVLPDQRGMT